MRNRRISMTSLISAILAAPSTALTVDGDTPTGGSSSPSTGDAPSALKTTVKKVKKAKPAPKAKVKKPAAKKAKKNGNITESTAMLREKAKDYAKPKGVKTAGGNQAIDNGDKVAKQLRGKSLDEVYKAAAAALKEPESALRAKYKHLNEGMQRMNLGNRMRAA